MFHRRYVSMIYLLIIIVKLPLFLLKNRLNFYKEQVKKSYR